MKPFEQQTYYEILEIPVTAPDAEIRAAYERALEMYAPDSVAVYTLVDPGQVDALRARITEAMEILTEPDLRAEYDRMIGVDRGASNTVVDLASSLAGAASAAPAEAPVAAAPAPSETPAVPAPSVEEAPAAAPEPVAGAAPEAPVAPPAPEKSPEPPASTAPPVAETPAATPAPAATPPSPEQLVVPGTMTPNQIHAAFRSYALSYVPVLVPSPSLTGAAALSPFALPVQPEAPQPTQEAPREARAMEADPPAPSAAPAPEAAVAQAPPPAAEPVQPPASTPVGAPEARSPIAAEPVPAPAVEGAPAPVTPPAAAVAEPPRAASAQAPPEPSPPPQPAPTPATHEQPASVVLHHEEDELSGVKAPLPSHAEPRPASHRPAVPPPGRSHKVSITPPPLPPGGRRTPHTPPPSQAGDAGRGTARPAHAASLHLEEAQQIAQESAIATAEAALAQVAAKAREPRPKPVDLPPNTEFNGELLRRVRESRGLSLHQLAERTRISSKHLENVEADRYPALPATVYLRGILMNIARELGLDPLRVSRSYLALASDQKKK